MIDQHPLWVYIDEGQTLRLTPNKGCTMYTFSRTITALLLFVSVSSGIGLQHGLFRSQSTQGIQWTGTAAITKEKFRITVYPDYLDVELDWTFTVGGTEPDDYKDALEIVGNLNLEDNSTIISMITWYKGKILKGKLKSNETARDQYEEVVERSSDAPPPPRDPVLLEMVRDDNYDISIFPAEFGGERRVRIRYLIPGKTVDGSVRMGYPHAFTDKAEVEIRCGTGVSGYTVETSRSIEPIFINTDFAPLSADEYSFKAYSSSPAIPGITYIVPVVNNPATGSRLYVSTFSTDNFSGSVVHASFPSARNMLLATAEKEDFVVIWRWNCTDILHAYTQQVIAQADALISFFNALNAASKRGALVISILDGETVSFPLDAPGGSTYGKMLDYLKNLSALPPPQAGTTGGTVTTLTSEEIKNLAQTALEEFKAALAAAEAMFDDARAAQRILFLTAGPQGTTSFDTFRPDTGVKTRFSPFSTVFSGTSTDFLSSVYTQRWPGVSLPQQLTSDTTLKLFGYIANGTRTDSFQVSVTPGYYQSAGLFDRYVYSDKPVAQSITWKLFSGGSVVQEITETPEVIPIEDGLQHARTICPLKCMMPLAATMPTSLASTLGFVDMKYTLLALEEDELDPAAAALYADTGVPYLLKEDIIPAADENTAIPTEEWLTANPREFPISYTNTWIILERAGGLVFDMDAVPAAAAVRWANPQADVIESPRSVIADAYQVVSVKTPTEQHAAPVSITVRNGYLSIPAALVTPAALRTMTIAIYDMKGRVITRLSIRDCSVGSAFTYKLPRMRPGVYCLRIEHASLRWSRSMLIR